MTPVASRPADRYSPLYFLASVGAGGLAVSFFMYLLFWVPHPDLSVPTYEHIAAAWGAGGAAAKAGILVAMAGIAVFAALNLRSLFWNLGAFAAFRRSPAYAQLRASNAESQLLALPLALAMSVNALFILGLVFVPGLRGVIEILFPAAMAIFVAIGALALRMIGRFLGRVLAQGGAFDMSAHNSFAQLLPAFALAMTGVGLASPAALSAQPATVGAALVLSTFFGLTAALYAGLAAITALGAMLQHGTSRDSAPTLMIVIPLMTILGILAMRQDHGLHSAFGAHSDAAGHFMLLTGLLTVQAVFLMLGLTLLGRHAYVATFVTGGAASPGSYALVCPGVALSVMLQFWINKGLVAVGLIAKFGAAYWALTGLALGFQVAMVALVLVLNRKHFARPRIAAVPAE